MADFLSKVKVDEQLFLRERIGLEDGTELLAQIKLLDKDEKELCCYEEEIYVENKRVELPFKIESIAKDNDVEVNQVASVKATIEADEEVMTEASKSVYLKVIRDDCSKTWDKHTNNRIETLHPKIRCKAYHFINTVKNTLAIKLRVTQALRTIQEQDDLYALGRTQPGEKVTWVKGGYSYHNYGLAIDICVIKSNGAVDWHADMSKIAQIGKKIGFEWGGDWKQIQDKPHFQISYGYTTSELIKRKKENEYVEI